MLSFVNYRCHDTYSASIIHVDKWIQYTAYLAVDYSKTSRADITHG